MHYGDEINRDFSTKLKFDDKWSIGHNPTFTDEVEIVRRGYEGTSDELPIELLKTIVAAHCRHRPDGLMPEIGAVDTVGDLVAELLRLDPRMSLSQAVTNGLIPKDMLDDPVSLVP